MRGFTKTRDPKNRIVTIDKGSCLTQAAALEISAPSAIPTDLEAVPSEFLARRRPTRLFLQALGVAEVYAKML